MDNTKFRRFFSPLSQSVLWVVSCVVSFAYDFGGVWPSIDAVIRIIDAYCIFLICEIAILIIDIRINMKGFYLTEDNYQDLVSLGMVGGIFTPSFLTGFFFIKSIDFIIGMIALAAYFKFAVIYAVRYIDENKKTYQEFGNL